MRTQRRRTAAIAAALFLVAPMAADLLTGAALADHTLYNEAGARIVEFHDAPVVAAVEETVPPTEETVDAGSEDSEYDAGGVTYGFYAARGYSSAMADKMAALRRCESGDDYTIATGNGYYGAYQFSAPTWWWLGYEGWPHHASPEVQDEAALALYEIYGWSPWPGCSWWLGL